MIGLKILVSLFGSMPFETVENNLAATLAERSSNYANQYVVILDEPSITVTANDRLACFKGSDQYGLPVQMSTCPSSWGCPPGGYKSDVITCYANTANERDITIKYWESTTDIIHTLWVNSTGTATASESGVSIDELEQTTSFIRGHTLLPRYYQDTTGAVGSGGYSNMRWSIAPVNPCAMHNDPVNPGNCSKASGGILPNDAYCHPVGTQCQLKFDVSGFTAGTECFEELGTTGSDCTGCTDIVSAPAYACSTNLFGVATTYCRYFTDTKFANCNNCRGAGTDSTPGGGTPPDTCYVAPPAASQPPSPPPLPPPPSPPLSPSPPPSPLSPAVSKTVLIRGDNGLHPYTFPVSFALELYVNGGVPIESKPIPAGTYIETASEGRHQVVVIQNNTDSACTISQDSFTHFENYKGYTIYAPIDFNLTYYGSESAGWKETLELRKGIPVSYSTQHQNPSNRISFTSLPNNTFIRKGDTLIKTNENGIHNCVKCNNTDVFTSFETGMGYIISPSGSAILTTS